VAALMILNFKSKVLERFWWKGDARKVDSLHVRKVRIILTALDRATCATDLNLPGFGFHRLSGDQAHRFAVKVDKNWRITFGWSADGPDAVDVNYEDYH
jgi:toxin HigB-1